jgi:SAM-dependent methyltransferase
VHALGAIELGPVLDVGCAGGAYSINLAKLGFDVVGTDHHPGVIERARQNASITGVSGKVAFLVDDACSSKIPDSSYSRAICISVTPSLTNDAAFEALIYHLDRVTRQPPGASRRIVLGHNRWRPTRANAIRGVLGNEPMNYVRIAHRLSLIQMAWWIAPEHLDLLKKRFTEVTMIGSVTTAIDGSRIDLLLQ